MRTWDDGGGTTLDPEEARRFEALADEWWDPHGKFRPLHNFNPARLGYLRGRLVGHFGRDPLARRPLEGLRLVDLGCGGGLVAEPMARLGASVVGCDAVPANVGAAAAHAAQAGLEIDYRHCLAEDLVAAGESFDVVLALEVVEHVADVPLFLHACRRLLRPGGCLVVATINRTAKSLLLAKIGAEYVLGWLPRGTHDWRRFLRPSEIAAHLRREGLTVRDVTGVTYAPLSNEWRLSADTDVNYMLTATAG